MQRKKPVFVEMKLHQAVKQYIDIAHDKFALKSVLFVRVYNEGKRTRWQQWAAKSEGMEAGIADWIATWSTGSLYLEGKSKTGRMSPNQKIWRAKCVAAEIPYVIFRSLNEFIAALQEHGLVRENVR